MYEGVCEREGEGGREGEKIHMRDFAEVFWGAKIVFHKQWGWHKTYINISIHALVHATLTHTLSLPLPVQSRRKLTLAHTGTRITQDRIEIRLLSIPLVFLLLRLWGTVQFFYVMPHTRTSHIQQCIPKQVHRILVPLGIMQVSTTSLITTRSSFVMYITPPLVH